MEKLDIYTDGACRGNNFAEDENIGGWGCLLIEDTGNQMELFGGAKNTTNNQMELMAAIRALEILDKPCAITLYTDSQYLVNGITKWVNGWIKNNWKTADKKPVKNKELWERLKVVSDKHIIKWTWVKGHSNDKFNIKADALANAGCDSVLTKIFTQQ